MADLRPVVHLLPAEPYGGLQRIVIELARAQRAAGRSAEIILLGTSARVEGYCRSAGIEPIMLSGNRLVRMFALRRVLAGFGAAIFHSHCEPIWAAAILAASGNPWIAHLHVYERHRTVRDRLSNWVYYRRVDRFVAITRSVAESYRARGVADFDRLEVVHNGLNYDALPVPVTRDEAVFTLSFVGRAVREKGLFDFLSTADLLRDDSAIRFLIAGDGENLAEARTTIDAMGLQERIRSLGFVDDMEPVWAQTDMLAMLSDREPFGLVILEAVAAGVAVLGYDTPSGGREIMETIPGCRLVAPASVPAIVKAVRLAAGDRAALRDEVAGGGRVVRDRYSLARMEAGVARVYAGLPEKAS